MAAIDFTLTTPGAVLIRIGDADTPDAKIVRLIYIAASDWANVITAMTAGQPLDTPFAPPSTWQIP